MLVAISLPPLTEDTKRHSPTKAHPARALAAAKAAEIAVMAKLGSSTHGVIASPPSSTQSAANEMAIFTARAEKRRTHPRAVVWGTSARLPPDARRRAVEHFFDNGADRLDHIQTTGEDEAR